MTPEASSRRVYRFIANDRSGGVNGDHPKRNIEVIRNSSGNKKISSTWHLVGNYFKLFFDENNQFK